MATGRVLMDFAHAGSIALGCDDLTLEAASKNLVAKAADNVEISASGVAKISGQDVKLNNPG